MDKDKSNQENYCLKAIYHIDALRTQLFQIESFDNFSVLDKRLKKLKQQLLNIYWEL